MTEKKPEEPRMGLSGIQPLEWIAVILLIVIGAQGLFILKQKFDYDIMKRERDYMWQRFEDYRNDELCRMVAPWFERDPSIEAPYLRELCEIEE